MIRKKERKKERRLRIPSKPSKRWRDNLQEDTPTYHIFLLIADNFCDLSLIK